MVSNAPRVSADVSPAAWIAPRLSRAFGAVSRTVPRGYPAYARLCHPVEGGEGPPMTWSEVAHATGRHAHPLMQWHALIGSSDPLNMTGSVWPGDDPERGNLLPDVLRPLCDLLADHTATPEHGYFCLWDGYGWIGGEAQPSATVRATDDPDGLAGPPAPAPRTFSANELRCPRVTLPGRDYLLLAGALPAALRIGWWMTVDGFVPQSPNLFWPADRAWCAATEIDFDST